MKNDYVQNNSSDSFPVVVVYYIIWLLLSMMIVFVVWSFPFFFLLLFQKFYSQVKIYNMMITSFMYRFNVSNVFIFWFEFLVVISKHACLSQIEWWSIEHDYIFIWFDYLLMVILVVLIYQFIWWWWIVLYSFIVKIIYKKFMVEYEKKTWRWSVCISIQNFSNCFYRTTT